MSTERPILFSAPMVRALLAGTKTQTRRVAKRLNCLCGHPAADHGENIAACGKFMLNDRIGVGATPCPYGQPGDRLWVRETCFINDFRGVNVPESERADCSILYKADPLPDWEGEEGSIVWRPSIHMPRWASRILLEVTAVRVERLQDISEEDAIAEGCKNSLHLPGGRFARENYAHLWWTINGDDSWEANPWVWVVEFKVVKGGAQ